MAEKKKANQLSLLQNMPTCPHGIHQLTIREKLQDMQV